MLISLSWDLKKQLQKYVRLYITCGFCLEENVAGNLGALSPTPLLSMDLARRLCGFSIPTRNPRAALLDS